MAPSSSKSSLSNGGGAGKNEKTANRKGGAVKMEPAEAPVSDINPATATQTQTELHDYVWLSGAALVLYKVLKTAYEIRLTSIREYGPVIHEYDPYFNYRATEYLYWNGSEKFFKWFDYLVWYPLGRPVGTTIYPGMQFTAVWIKRYLLNVWTLNDICCYIPAWFGVVATFMTGMLAYECSIPANTSSNIFVVLLDILRGSQTPVCSTASSNTKSVLGLFSPAAECALISMAMMSIVPAHLMRSMGGGYDNESVAVTAMVTTFYFWVRSLRATDPNSHWIGIITGLAYFYMVAAWGGYVFVLNLIGCHAAALVAMGRFSNKVYGAYTLFYVVGTSLAIQIPVVGWAPLKSLEQLGPAVVFGAFQLLFVTEYLRKKQQLSRKQGWIMRIQFFVAAAVLVVTAGLFLAPQGYFGPISARVRGLFVLHTKTGNPLVDSVAEHQAASTSAYFQYLHHVCTLAPVGYAIVFFTWSDSSSFLIVWGTAAYFFSHKMVRLILLTAPIGSILGGIAAGRIFAWCVQQWWKAIDGDEPADGANGDGGGVRKFGKKGKKSKSNQSPSGFDAFKSMQETANSLLSSKEGVLTKRTVALLVLLLGYLAGGSFVKYCWQLSETLSNPTIVQKARLRDGRVILLDDYRDAYNWLKDNTPEDSRVMAWWDYGYQIAGIANRTTIADGNTWNHEHIALLGKAFTTDLDMGWEITRHWADYVLIWGGGMGDDLGKSPHLARIANSVYRDHCPGDPTCRAFGFLDREMTPSVMMERSLLYRLHGHKIKPGVVAPEDKFQEVYRSKYGKVRIFKVMGISEKSKEWVADPANRVCDVPGSWFCPGQYPPGLSEILSSKKDFQQLEDFNRGKNDDDYQKQYFEDLFDPDSAKRKHLLKEREQSNIERKAATPDEELKKQAIKVDEIYNTWEDTEDTTLMWKLISTNAIEDLKAWLEAEPHKAFIRSKDGRGPMFWSFELRHEEATKLLMKAGVPHTDRDAKGMTPVDLLEGGK